MTARINLTPQLSEAAMQLLRLCIPLTVLAIATLAGCASGYREFYVPVAGATPEAISAIRTSPAPAMPATERVRPGDMSDVVDAYAKRSFILIGSAMFNSGHTESDEAAIEQGKKIAADLVVLINPRYTGSTTTAVPVTTPTTSTTYSTGTATAYGSAGSATAYGSTTSTTYGASTTYVPITTHRVDYGALYFVKRSYVFGVIHRDLSDAERREQQSNKGVAVRIVVDDSPAFDADILVGDIIAAVDGIEVTNSQSLSGLLRTRQGQKIDVSISRSGTRLTKTVHLQRER